MHSNQSQDFLRKLRTFSKKNWFWIITALVLILAGLIRFHNFTSRFAFEEDQARDALIIQEIVDTKRFPLMGPSSSIGPFSFGPWYYWILSISYFLFPFFFTPWVVVTCTSILFVYVLIMTGRQFGGEAMGLMSGLLATVSTAELRLSAHLSNLSFVSFFSALAFFTFVSFLKKGKVIFIFLMGLSIAFAINMHFSAIILLSLIFPLFFIKMPKFKSFAALSIGLLVPFIPFFILNILHGWVIFRNLFNFFIFGQQKFLISTRWLTYLSDFWPEFWSNVIGGSKFVSYFIFFIISLFVIRDLYKKKLDKIFLALLFTFILQVVILRYWRGEKQDIWLLFFNPLILLLTTWGVWKLFYLNKILSVLIIIILMTGSLIADIPHLNYVNQFSKIKALKEELILEYPNSTFLLHNCRYSSAKNASLPLLLLLTRAGKIDLNGKPIGVFLSPAPEEIELFKYSIKAKNDSYVIVELKPGEIPKECVPITKSSLYNEETVSRNL